MCYKYNNYFFDSHSNTQITQKLSLRGVYDEAIPSKSSISLKIAIHFNFLSIIENFIEMKIYNPLILSYFFSGDCRSRRFGIAMPTVFYFSLSFINQFAQLCSFVIARAFSLAWSR
jgi:hypothetical protein